MFRVSWMWIVGLASLGLLRDILADETSVCPYVQTQTANRCQSGSDLCGHPLDGSRCSQGMTCPTSGCPSATTCDPCTDRCPNHDDELETYADTCPGQVVDSLRAMAANKPTRPKRSLQIELSFTKSGFGALAKIIGAVPTNTSRPADAEERAAAITHQPAQTVATNEDCPAPLVMDAAQTRVDAELARLQHVYHVLKESGLDMEAASVASRIQHGSPTVLFHQSAYQPTLPNFSSDPITFQGGDVAWDEAAEHPVSVHFEGKGVDDVAYFFHLATGMTVRVEPCGEALPKVFVTSEHKTVRRTLQKVLGTCKWGYCVVDGELVLAPAKHLDRFQKPGIISGLDVWRGE